MFGLDTTARSEEVRVHRIGVISAGGWCEGSLYRMGLSLGARLFDGLRDNINGGLTLHYVTSSNLGKMAELQISGTYIEAIVDLEERPAADPKYTVTRSYIPVHILTASGVIIDGNLVAPVGGTLPELTSDYSVEPRIITGATINLPGRKRVVENATLLLDVRHVVYLGRQ
jgi:hypothetical protein